MVENLLFILAALFCAWLLGHVVDASLNKVLPGSNNGSPSNLSKESNNE